MKIIKHWSNQFIVPAIKKLTMMRKMMIKVLILGLFSFIIVIILFLFTKSTIISGIACSLLLLIIIVNPALLILNKLIKRTNWYLNQLEDGMKFRKQISCNLDICNLGSNSGKFAFSYEDIEEKGENWAIGPQTLSYDFRVLKNYFSYLKEGAIVLIPLCPFSSCIIDFQDDLVNNKYYSFLHPVLIPNYSPDIKTKVNRFLNNPFHVYPFTSVKRLIKDVQSNNKILQSTESMDELNLEKNASEYIKNWKNEFAISELRAPVSEKNLQNIAYNSNLLRNMISFCLSRQLKPVIILPPVTKILSSYFSDVFYENYIYSLAKNNSTNEVPFLNFFNDKRFEDNNLFIDSYLLNVNGRKLFTKVVLEELHSLRIII